ncbi:MAG: glycosyltransferase [Candidatus Brocadiaceae bacterium]
MINLVLFYTCAASALIWLAFLCMPARWRMSEQWEAEGQPIQPLSVWPRLSIIVPARNERESLPLTLPSWLKQDYPNSEIILVDDQSSDGTAACAHITAQQYNRTVTVINGTPPPPGWTGKLWALEQGIRASSGDWLLFTDADILHNPGVWRGLIVKALSERYDMVSLMALLDTKKFWARLLIPAFVYFFHIMYPFGKVKDPRSKIYGAAGGCVLVSRQVLDNIGGIAEHRGAWIDDLALARRVKCAGWSQSLSLTKSVISIRPYPHLQDTWKMVARSAFTQLKHSWLTLMGTVIVMSTMFISPVAGIGVFIWGSVSSGTAIASIAALLSMTITYLPMMRFFGLSKCRAFTLPVAGTLYLAMTISSAINHVLGKREWRGVRAKTRQHNDTSK